MRLLKGICLFFISIFLCSCGSKAESHIALTKNSPVESENIKVFQTQQLRKLNIDLKNADISFYSWEKKLVKIEIEAQTTQKENKMNQENILNLYSPFIEFKDDVLTIKQNEKVKNESNKIIYKIKISSPSNITNMFIKVENGLFKSFGDLSSIAKMEIANGKIDLSRFDGICDATIDKGNINISSGKLKGASKFESNVGNIHILTEILTNDEYVFETNVGNIELRFPARLLAKFFCQGNIESNDFNTSSIGPNIKVSTKAGSITLKKY